MSNPISEIRFYLKKTMDKDWINSVPDPLSLFTKFLIETGKVASHNDRIGREYVLLEDLLPYRGIKVPNTFYDRDDSNSALIEVSLRNFIARSISESGSKYALDIADILRKILVLSTGTYTYWAYTSLDELMECIEEKINMNDELKEMLVETKLLYWFDFNGKPENPTTLQMRAVGSADWNIFVYANETSLVYIQNDIVSGFGGSWEDVECWEKLNDLFGELDIKHFVFSAHEVYNIDKGLFVSVYEHAHIWYTSEACTNKADLNEYDRSSNLYVYHNADGSKVMTTHIFVCEDCGQLFYLCDKEKKAMMDQHISLPKTCIKCRKVK